MPLPSRSALRKIIQPVVIVGALDYLVEFGLLRDHADRRRRVHRSGVVGTLRA